MENNFDNQFVNDLATPPARPQFLKILCILTFIMCGLMILLYAIGTLCLAVDAETAEMWGEKMLETNPNMKINTDNWAEFFSGVGKASVIALLFNIASLVGAIMMWRLNKIGFFIYAVAEIAINFVSISFNASAEGGKSYGMLIFTIIIDLAFIGMYAANLKAMNKNASASTPQVQ